MCSCASELEPWHAGVHLEGVHDRTDGLRPVAAQLAVDAGDQVDVDTPVDRHGVGVDEPGHERAWPPVGGQLAKLDLAGEWSPVLYPVS